jgi:hypothetical protein
MHKGSNLSTLSPTLFFIIATLIGITTYFKINFIFKSCIILTNNIKQLILCNIGKTGESYVTNREYIHKVCGIHLWQTDLLRDRWVTVSAENSPKEQSLCPETLANKMPVKIKHIILSEIGKSQKNIYEVYNLYNYIFLYILYKCSLYINYIQRITSGKHAAVCFQSNLWVTEWGSERLDGQDKFNLPM